MDKPSANGTPSGVRGDLALLGLTAFWGSTFPVVRAALRDVSPNLFLALRFGLGALAAAVVARGALRDRRSLRVGMVLGVVLYAGFAFQTVGLPRTTSTRSAFLTALSVLLVPPLAYLLFRKTFHPLSYVGALIATIGLFVLTAPFSDGSKGLLLGDALTLGCSFSFALHIVLADRWAPDVSPAAVAAVQSGVSALLSAVALPFENLRWSPTASALETIVYTGVVGSAGALTVQLWGQARTTAMRAALIFALEPVFAALFASAFAADVIGANEVAGGALVLLGVGVGQVGPSVLARQRSA